MEYSKNEENNGYINEVFSTHIEDAIIPMPTYPSFPEQNNKSNRMILGKNNNSSAIIVNASSTTQGNQNDRAAVLVYNACKSFKEGGKMKPVLESLCMTVKQGTIYGLLGSSGCGKTTLLNCVVGMKNLDSGTILVFGEETGSRFSGVPGKMVGFMPQETALYRDFTIKETMTYFGSLYGMKKEEVKINKAILMELLNLPDESRRVSSLSGGQKRRVSLCCALIHTPPLIILDEPTVGVDPILRDNIWKYLMKLVAVEKTTVIITTHYLEEARSCDTIGVMRRGRLLTENSPKTLFEKYNTQSLEDVVLELCQDDENAINLGIDRVRSRSNSLKLNNSMDVGNKNKQNVYENGSCTPAFSARSSAHPKATERMKDSLIRIKSLVMKNVFVMMRNIFLVLFVILLPGMQTVIMGMSMGNDPKPIKVGVVNHDFPYVGGCSSDMNISGECQIANLSCRYLRNLPADIELFNYSSEDEARNDIKVGKIRSFVSFPANYSDAVYERATSGFAVENETLQLSIMTFEMDASNAVITKSLQRIVYDTYQAFVKGLLADCGLNPDLGGLPIKFENPIYGRYDLELREYVAAGMLVGVALFFPLCSSSITYIWDKKQGTMERARVAGTQTFEIMTSYFVTEGLTLTLQICILYLILLYVFNITIVGSSCLAIILLLLNGFAGITLGLLIASFCTEEIQAILLGLAIIFPNYFLAGALWPVEGMPKVLQYFSYFLPGTLANEAFRSIVVRGWGFTHFYVWTGFASTLAWLCFYWIMVIVVHRLSHRKN